MESGLSSCVDEVPVSAAGVPAPCRRRSFPRLMERRRVLTSASGMQAASSMWPTARIHGALLLTQFCWGSAAVVNKLGLSGVGMMPLLFALIREASAAPLLFALLWKARRARGPGGQAYEEAARHADDNIEESVRDLPRKRVQQLALRLLPGLFIFMDQLCSLTGVSLADPVSAAAWQPSQVVFTVVICFCIGMETFSVCKAAGVLLTIGGAVCLVLLEPRAGAHQGRQHLLGQLFFFVNCLASSLEVITWRCLLQHSSAPLAHFAVMAESYLVAALLMACACMAVSFSPAATKFFCPACDGNAWYLPPQAMWSIAYSVVFQTIIGYVLQAWALRHCESTLASLYATAQPIWATLVSCLLLLLGINPGGVLSWPGREMLGALLIIAGLVCTEMGRSGRGRSSDEDASNIYDTASAIGNGSQCHAEVEGHSLGAG